MSESFARARARKALTEAGLDPRAPLQRASSVTNEVWMTDRHVVRVNRRPNQRLRREAELGPLLPPEVRYPHVVGYGGELGADWLVVERVTGQTLSAAWPLMSVVERRKATRQLAAILQTVHQVEVPAGLSPVDDAPQLLDTSSFPVVTPLLEALDRVQDRPGIDRGLIADARHLVVASTPALEPFGTTTLIHGDLHFQNIIWDGFTITGLIDWEWSRGGPPDLDLDVFLRFSAYPHWHVADEHAATTLAADYAPVPYWMAECYPELFAHDYVLERTLVYEISYDVFDLVRTPIEGSARDLPDWHPHKRLEHTLRGRSHLHRLAGEVMWDAAAAALPVDVGAPPLARATPR